MIYLCNNKKNILKKEFDAKKNLLFLKGRQLKTTKMWLSKKTVWCLMIYLAFGIGSARHHYRRGGETIPNVNEPAQIFYQEPPPPPGSVRPKRESFVDLDSIPKMMRGFAQNLGRGFNSMVQHSQKIASQGHKVVSETVQNMMHNMPTIIYGNWKPIPSSEPSYPIKEGSYMQPPPPREPPVSSYVPAAPEPYVPPAAPEPYVPPYTQPTFQPVLEPAKPIYTIPEQVFVKPEPVYVKPSAPTPGPSYVKPFENEGTPISYPAVPAVPAYETGFLLDPEVPTEPPAPIVITTEAPKDQIIMAHGIPAEYSQNPEHIHKITGHTLWYKNTKKLKGKQKMVEGDLANYRPRPPGPSLRLLRSR